MRPAFALVPLAVLTAAVTGVPLFPPGPLAKKDAKTEGPRAGGAPEQLRSETVADVLKEVYGRRAKVFGLSLKDRAAVLPVGKRPDGAYWLDTARGVFVTSTYY